MLQNDAAARNPHFVSATSRRPQSPRYCGTNVLSSLSGRALGEDERPPDRLLNFVAEQLGVSIVAWDLYAQRDETRREHLLELLSRLGLEQFGTKHYRAISAWLGSTALQTTVRSPAY